MIASAVSFNKKLSLILIPVTFKTETDIISLDFAVDTGATYTLIDINSLANIGYKKSDSIGTSRTVTASKSEIVYEFKIDNIMALGLIRRNFKVFSRALPFGLGIDGLLGLNFFRNQELIIDFKMSEIRINL